MSRLSILAWWIALIVGFGFFPAASMCAIALLLVGAPLYGHIVQKMDKKVEAKTDLLCGASAFSAMCSETVLSLIKAGNYKGITYAPKFKMAERGGSREQEE